MIQVFFESEISYNFKLYTALRELPIFTEKIKCWLEVGTPQN